MNQKRFGICFNIIASFLLTPFTKFMLTVAVNIKQEILLQVETNFFWNQITVKNSQIKWFYRILKHWSWLYYPLYSLFGKHIQILPFLLLLYWRILKYWCIFLINSFLFNSASTYLIKVNNNGSTRMMCEICWKLTIKTPERRHWRRSGVFFANFEQISHIVLVFPWLTLNK